MESPLVTLRAEDCWIVVPAFNEGPVIAGVMAELRARYPHVVVVDDCSTDNTGQAALSAGCTLLRHPINLGAGAATQTGISYALQQGALAIVTFDADGQHLVGDIQTLCDVQADTGADIVLGSRFMGRTEGLPPVRRLVLKAAIVFTHLTTGLKLSDAHNGLRLLTRAAASRILLRQNRMAHASELIDQIVRSGLKVAEAPVTVVYTEYSLAKGQKLSNGFRILAELLAARLGR